MNPARRVRMAWMPLWVVAAAAGCSSTPPTHYHSLVAPAVSTGNVGLRGADIERALRGAAGDGAGAG